MGKIAGSNTSESLIHQYQKSRGHVVMTSQIIRTGAKHNGDPSFLQVFSRQMEEMPTWI